MTDEAAPARRSNLLTWIVVTIVVLGCGFCLVGPDVISWFADVVDPPAPTEEAAPTPEPEPPPTEAPEPDEDADEAEPL